MKKARHRRGYIIKLYLYRILENVNFPAPVASKSLQSCQTLCDPRDGSPPGSSIPGILQARTLEWVAISVCNAWKWKVKVKSLSQVQLFVTPCTAAYQAPPSMGFSRQEYWSGVPLHRNSENCCETFGSPVAPWRLVQSREEWAKRKKDRKRKQEASKWV